MKFRLKNDFLSINVYGYDIYRHKYKLIVNRYHLCHFVLQHTSDNCCEILINSDFEGRNRIEKQAA